MKKILALVMALCMVFALCACGSTVDQAQLDEILTTVQSIEEKVDAQTAEAEEAPAEEAPAEEAPAEDAASDEAAAAMPETLEATTIYIDIAASLEAVFVEQIIPAFEEMYPDVDVQYNTGSSGKLLTGIEEANGIGHDFFFSAGKKQVKTLDEDDGLVIADSTVNLLSNQLCLVKGNDVETAVTGWENINEANSMALCPGSVPVGKYSRIALVSLGYLEDCDAPEDYTTEEIVAALGGNIEIDEADDVEVAAAKAAEGSVEVATIYYSDYYNHSDELTIIAQDDGTLTGDIIYPVCLVSNSEADEAETAAAAALLQFVQTQQCLDWFAQYDFIVNE